MSVRVRVPFLAASLLLNYRGCSSRDGNDNNTGAVCGDATTTVRNDTSLSVAILSRIVVVR